MPAKKMTRKNAAKPKTKTVKGAATRTAKKPAKRAIAKKAPAKK